MWRPRSRTVAMVVQNPDGNVLVIRRRDIGHLQAPGGILEQAERIEDGLAREVKEETGYSVVPDQLTGIYKHMTLGVVALVFRRRLTGGEAQINVDRGRTSATTMGRI